MKKWLKVLLIVVCVLALILVAAIILVKKVLVPKVTDVAIEKAVYYVVPDECAAEELIGSLSPEDKQFAEDVISGYLFDKEARKSFLSFVEKNDYTAIKDYAVENLTKEQLEQALEIAEKYQEFLPPEGIAMLETYLDER